MGFVNDVINCECLGCVIYFRIKEKEREKKKDTFYIEREKKKRHILYQLLFYNIPPKLFFILFLISIE